MTLPGFTAEDGSVITASQYTESGSGGRVIFAWTETALDTAGDMVGEVDVTFPDGSVQTVYELVRFRVREQF